MACAKHYVRARALIRTCISYDHVRQNLKMDMHARSWIVERVKTIEEAVQDLDVLNGCTLWQHGLHVVHRYHLRFTTSTRRLDQCALIGGAELFRKISVLLVKYTITIPVNSPVSRRKHAMKCK